MYIIPIFFLLYFGLLALAIFMAIGACIACITRKWLLAAGMLCVCGAAVPCAFSIHSTFLEDDIVREPISVGELAGTYYLQEPSAQYVERMGYKDFTAEIVLRPEGEFSAKRIPACCVYGEDDRKFPSAGGYYELAGSWTTEPGSYSAYYVKLEMKSVRVSDQRPGMHRKMLFDNEVKDRDVRLLMFKGKLPSVGFRIWTGADYYYVHFSKKSG